MSEIKFVDGLMVKKPHYKAPDFIKASLSIKREELISWLQGESSEWINIDVKESKKGSWYAQVNDWQAGNQDDGQQGQQGVQQSKSQSANEDIGPSEPFAGDDDFDIDLKDVPF